MSGLTRDEMRRDEVREAVFSVSNWVVEHVRQILVGVALAIVGVVGVVLYLGHRDGVEKQASFQLGEALKVYRAPINEPETDAIDDLFGTPPDSAPGDTAPGTEESIASVESDPGTGDELSFDSEAARRAAARAELEAVRDEYGSTAAAALAGAWLGQIAAAEGDTALARELWTGYLEDAGRDHIVALGVQLNLYSLDRAEGRGEELAAELRGAVAAGSSPLPKEALLFELGATLAQLGDDEGARGAWQRVLDEYPDSAWAVRARRQLGPEASAAAPFSFGG